MHIVLISCNCVGYFVSKLGICMPDALSPIPTKGQVYVKIMDKIEATTRKGLQHTNTPSS